MSIKHEAVQLISGLGPFGVVIHATVYEVCWIESEQVFHGKTKEGTKYAFWNVAKGKSREYRKIWD